MAIKRKKHEAEVSTESLSDIMFFLMLFFLILSTMVSPNVLKVNLPSSKPAPKPPNKDKPIHLSVSKDKKYLVESEEVNFLDLEKILATKIKGVESPVVVLNVDRECSYQDFIDLLQIGDHLKCKMLCATQSSNGK